MDNVKSLDGQEQARTIENEEPIIETGRFEVYEKGNRGKIDGDLYRKFGEIAQDLGREYMRAFTVDEVTHDGAMETIEMDFTVDTVGYVILDKSTLLIHAIIAPELVEMDFAEHLNLTIEFLQSFDDRQANKRADVYEELLDDLDKEPVEGTEMELA
ncbi:hypothetical protein [Salinibacter ruber]|jgi:hypothetical protein|uniref:hypothetical protein n=1 Tax=Salinibacter ruber TaxID=146919 RepID=UPI002072C82D|nr:hypothetical protein [Salinibacter ruber]